MRLSLKKKKKMTQWGLQVTKSQNRETRSNKESGRKGQCPFALQQHTEKVLEWFLPNVSSWIALLQWW